MRMLFGYDKYTCFYANTSSPVYNSTIIHHYLCIIRITIYHSLFIISMIIHHHLFIISVINHHRLFIFIALNDPSKRFIILWCEMNRIKKPCSIYSGIKSFYSNPKHSALQLDHQSSGLHVGLTPASLRTDGHSGDINSWVLVLLYWQRFLVYCNCGRFSTF